MYEIVKKSGEERLKVRKRERLRETESQTVTREWAGKRD